MPPPSNPPSRHSPDPDPNPDPEPHPNPPPPPPNSDPDPSKPNNTIDSDSDSDDDMSKATKAFDKVMKLEKDRSNWSTWVTRVQRAAGSIGYNKYLTTAPTSAAEEQQQDKDLLNGIIGTLPDTIFRRYKNKPTSKELWDALKQEYDAKDPLTEPSLEKQLISLTCTNPAKFGKHLNNLVAIMDELADRGVSIPDSQFKSAIISSTPNMYQATVKVLITVYREEPSKLTPEMLIAAIRAEAQGKNFASSSNKSQESANYSNNNFQGRGRGGFRGRGGRGREEAEEDHHSEVKEISEEEAKVEQEEIGKATIQQGRNPTVTIVEDLVHLSTCSVLMLPENTEMIGIIEKTERMERMDNKGMEKKGIQQAVLEKGTKKIVKKKVGWPLKFQKSKTPLSTPLLIALI
ncbi:hypothetical protein D9758_015887 [Tetrapyrgos nigripes]|uniref:Gag protein n=1 Tax=Tetrapyrgos nigripes TaxID=182062 RepID=A0A8H5FNM5_9AGAR|nr:hypothetical protein D9758_015887 [Tetrapyrgos nigripes]